MSNSISKYISTLTSDAQAQIDALQVQVDILAARRDTQLLTLASLAPGGVWYPQQYVGPTCGNSSSVDLTGYTVGVGFFQVPRTGVLRNFKYTTATYSYSNFYVDLYLSFSGPFSFSYTGVGITLGAYTFVAENVTDTLPVNAGDLLVWYSSDPFVGYTSDALTITAELVIDI